MPVKIDQVYSNTRVPTQANTNQHESDAIQHEFNTSLTQVNMSPTRVNTNQHVSDTGQVDHEIIIVYRSLVGKVWQLFDSTSLREKCPNTDIFLIRIFPHSAWIRRDTAYHSVFSPNAGEYGPEKLRIWTLFTQCLILRLVIS